ncbi:VOC family protein [Mesobacillus maritimus]|uniref:VOC family protein n=1 Tax=Mesobacillus maritimus TaxID=1643336 RepID=UPI00384EC237
MSFIFKAIDHIQLAAPKESEETARRFFIDVLGFVEIEKPESLKQKGGVWFQCGNIQVHIGIEEPFSPAQKAHPAFEVENIEELKRHLTNQDIGFTEDGHLPGANRIYINDPFGNRIEILEWR